MEDLIVAGIPVETILGDLGQYGGLVTRGPVDPNFPGLPGPIDQIAQTNTNLGKVKVQGLDFEIHARTPAQTWGRLAFDATGTYYLKYDTQNLDGSYTSADRHGVRPGDHRRDPALEALRDGQLALRPVDGRAVEPAPELLHRLRQDDLDGDLRKVSTMSLWDLQGSWAMNKNLKFTLGVKNLFDEDPPLTNQQYTFQSGYDPSYYDARARFVYGAVNWKFW